MTARSLGAGVICAIFCIAMLAATDSAYAAAKHRKRAALACEPAVPGRICPPFQFSHCVPCRMRGGAPGCGWTPCAPPGR